VIVTLLTLFGQESPDSGAVLRYLGPFVVFAVPTTFWIRDLSSRLKSSIEREQLLSDRLVELAEKQTPALASVAETLPKIVKELERRELRREQ
jgi:hypothetical protein